MPYFVPYTHTHTLQKSAGADEKSVSSQLFTAVAESSQRLAQVAGSSPSYTRDPAAFDEQGILALQAALFSAAEDLLGSLSESELCDLRQEVLNWSDRARATDTHDTAAGAVRWLPQTLVLAVLKWDASDGQVC